MRILKRSLVFLVSLVFLGSTIAFAVPFSIPNAEVRFKFVGLEQISPTNEITTTTIDEFGNVGTVNEGTWGILRMESVSTPRSGNITLWSRGSGDEITGIFYGFTTIETPAQGAPLQSTGGSLRLYYQESPLIFPDLDPTISTPGLRTSQTEYTGFTTGEFLIQIDFLDGAQQTLNDPNASLVGNTVPTTVSSFTGVSAGFGKINLAAGGTWVNKFLLNYYDTDLGVRTADFEFDNRYTGGSGHLWNDPNNPNIFGATFDDPGYAHGVPEPGTMLLLGIGLLGLAAYGRKRYIRN